MTAFRRFSGARNDGAQGQRLEQTVVKGGQHDAHPRRARLGEERGKKRAV